jgi:hypothetical protein
MRSGWSAEQIPSPIQCRIVKTVSSREPFVRVYALVKIVFCASYLARRRKEVLAIFHLLLRRLLHKEVNVLSGPNYECGLTLNTASPTKMPAAKKMKAMMSQITPQTCEGQHPQISANADASLVLTFRLIVSSIVSHKTAAGVRTQAPGSGRIIHTIHAAHDAHE